MRLGLFLSAGVVLLGTTSTLPAQTTGKPFGQLSGNRVVCGLSQTGRLCTGTGFSGAGVWPAGTFDLYVFTSGIQFAAVIPDSAGGGRPAFSWAGDTVGAFIEDLNSTTLHSEALSGVFDSRDTADIAAWPVAAVIRDPALFDAGYVGRPAASNQDVWMRYWEGNPRLFAGRPHPMGLVIDQRALSWNYPGVNADVIYFVFTIYNVTPRTAGAYNNPTIPAELRNDLATLGARFQDSSEAQLGVQIPDGGYRLDSLYVGMQMDHDIAIAGENYGTASLPFEAGIGYSGRFNSFGWAFPLEIFGAPPFTPLPGLVGVTFPRSPGRLGMFSTLGSGGSFPPPRNSNQLWRYLSVNMSPAAGDNPCNIPGDPKVRHACFVHLSTSDSKFMLSFGPTSLAPGEAHTFVMAYSFAAPLDTANAYAGGDMKPGFPFTGDTIAADSSKISVVERMAGWRTQADANGNGAIEPAEVTTVRRSLLFKTQVAQAFVDHKFAAPTGPAAPDFFLVPGDNQVTVVWKPSLTESTGDPYFAIAADSTSPLFDPNYRQFDVEGYRIYRGRDPRSLTLIAQVDYELTTFIDYVGAVAYPGRCAPELGITTDCPVAFGPIPGTAVSDTMPIAGRIVQVAEGGRTQSTSGAIAQIQPDTFPSATYPPLNNRPVTYTYTDSSARNSFRYYYAVTAFDFNSIRSGPSSFESQYMVKATTPRAPSGQETAGGIGPLELLGADGTVLDRSAPIPAIDPATGIFAGPMPPADGLALLVNALLPELLADGTLVLTVDSTVPGAANLFGLEPRPVTYFLRVQGPGVSSAISMPVGVDGFERDASAHIDFRAIGLSDSQSSRFGGDSTYSLTATATITVPGVWRTASWGRADANLNPQFSSHNGPRWWAGAANENTPAPNSRVCTPAIGSCIQSDLSLNAGRLPGVDTLFHLQAYSTVPNTPMRELESIGGTVYRAADMRVYWGAAGTIDSVMDVTHRVHVPFNSKMRASWGILTDASFAATAQASTPDGNNGLLTWVDALCVDPVPTYQNQCGGAATTPAALQNQARLSAVSARSSTFAGAASLTPTGQGFVFYLNGHFFLMQLAALPAAGTVWNVRFYAGTVTGTAAEANYAFVPAIRPPAVPGLRASLAFQGTQLHASITTDSLLARIHTVPDPFYVQSGYETAVDSLQLKFVHLPAQAIVRIYSTSGILVAMLLHNDATGGGELTWDLRSRTGRRVASGVYFYQVETPDKRSKLGRFTVVTGPHARQ